jgi:hypothetical protein
MVLGLGEYLIKGIIVSSLIIGEYFFIGRYRLDQLILPFGRRRRPRGGFGSPLLDHDSWSTSKGIIRRGSRRSSPSRR